MAKNKRINLRPYESSDVHDTLKWINDQEIKKAINRVLPVSLFEHNEWYKRVIQDKSQVIFAIDSVADKKYIGNCGLKKIDSVVRKAEMWIYIGANGYEAQGIGNEVTLKLLQYGFNYLNLNRIYLYVAEYNKKALNLYEKIGFTQEGVFRQDIFTEGKYHNKIWLSVLKTEFDELFGRHKNPG